MVVYGAGYAAIFLVHAAMTYRAWRWRARLELDERERLITRASLRELLLQAGVASLSAALSLAGRPDLGGWSYFLIGPLLGLHGWRAGRAVEAAAARAGEGTGATRGKPD